MTDLDLTPAGLRKLADNWCPASECRPDDGIEDRMAHTLRALADRMEARKQNSVSPCQLCGDTTGVCKRTDAAAANCSRPVMAWSGTTTKDTQP